MENAKGIVSCGGVVIFRNKVLVLYKNQNGRYMGWVMPKGSLEQGETYKQAALREVREESGVNAKAIKYLGKTQYSFKASPENEIIFKTVHWYLMTTNSFYCKPQAEEFFADVGFYKQHEAYHLLKFHDEKQIMRRAFVEYEKEAKRFKNKKTERNNENEKIKRLETGSKT
jgi:ADP-ribose pyrophosphatase YjhB (NUDIX family)